MTYVPPRPEPSEYHEYYHRYVQLVKHSNIVTALLAQLDDTMSLLHTVSAAQALYRYAPDKWSIKEVLGHVVDSERVFTYRALRFSRGDETPLAGFDQDAWIKTANSDARTWGSMKEEFELVRRSTVAFYSSLEPSAWTRRGTAWERPFTVRAMAYITAGHELNHVGIIRSRYLGREDVE